jgi:RimJ/RimL family protein N-acetyltransferase
MEIPMKIQYVEFTPDDAETLAGWLASDTFPFHSGPGVTREIVLERVEKGVYANERTRTFWIVLDDGTRAGLVQLRDIADPTPLFDLRLRTEHRGKGIGTDALRWLTEFLFTTYPAIERIEGTTRQDNYAMRSVFRRCGYVKEAHYRLAWHSIDRRYDAMGYAILREDWERKSVTLPEWNDLGELSFAIPVQS